jgi:hypothetical protein
MHSSVLLRIFTEKEIVVTSPGKHLPLYFPATASLTNLISSGEICLAII